MATSLRLIFVALAIGCSAASSPVSAALFITGYTDATNDRFSDDPAFIAGGFDLSGIGQTGTGRWATAISRNVVISAAHRRPTGQVHFYPGNDPSANPVVRSIVSGSRVGSSDLHVSLLNKPLPSSISHYSFANEMLTGPPPDGDKAFLVPAGVYQDMNAYMFGLSPFNKSLDLNRSGHTDQAVGRNLISGYSENFPFQTNTDNDTLILFFDAEGEPNHVQYESRVVGGDSGAPLFVDMNGEFRLLGVNSFRFTDNSGSGVTYVGNKTAVINGYIAYYAVPEPGTMAILTICTGAVVLRRSGVRVRGKRLREKP